MSDSSIETLSFDQAVGAVKAAHDADVTIGLIGPPGIGKSTIPKVVSKLVGKPLYILIGSNADPTDIGGLPVVLDDQLQRIPLPQIRACAEKPGIFFLDELTGCPRSVQGPLMRGLLEKVFGDIELHKDSYVMGAWNPPKQIAGGQALAAATGSRIIQIEVRPTLDEIVGFFSNLGDGALLSEAREFAATLKVQPALLQIDPPKVALESGSPWGAPRSWERGLRAFVSAGGDRANPVAKALLAGAVSREMAIQYFGIKDMRVHLPSVDQIIADPFGVKVPDEKHQIAAVGLLSRVAEIDAGPAWIYVTRLRPEISVAAASALSARNNDPMSPKWAEKGYKAMEEALAKIGKRISRR